MRGKQAKRLRRLALTTCESAGISGNTYEMESMHDIPIHGIVKGMRVVVGWWRWGTRKVKGVHGVYKQLKKHFKKEKTR